MFSLRWLTLFVAGFISLVAGPSGRPGVPLDVGSAVAATLIPLSLDQICQRATVILAGTPQESMSVWEDSAGARGRRIVTYTRVRVDQVIDGSAPGEVWVRTLGGAVDDIGQRVDGEAILVRDQPGLFFLRRNADGPHGVVGMTQGHLRLDATRVTPGARVFRLPSVARFVAPPVSGGAGALPAGLEALEGKTLAQAVRLIRTARQAHAP
jgi:hypothetical protein